MKAWVISDTHTLHGFLDIPLEDDIAMVIHAGDATNWKDPYLNNNEFKDFIEWYHSLHFPYKVFIPGNHDTSFEKGMHKGQIPNDITILDHKLGNFGGIRIFGSPYTPTFGVDWAYNRARDKIGKAWQQIPEGIDVLVTHGPPQTILDCNQDGKEVGCKSLYTRVKEIKPRYHIFGHIHEQAGRTLKEFNNPTTYINAATVNFKYQKINDGIIIDL